MTTTDHTDLSRIPDDVRRQPTDDELLTIDDAIAFLRVPRSTFYYWRQRRRGPKSIKLPNGEIRIWRSDLATWLQSREEAA